MTVSLVVGAGGFVGRHLRRHLHHHGDEVRCVSARLDVPSWPGPGLREPDEGRIAAALAGIDRVYFVGGVAHEALALNDAEALHDVNVAAPLRWLRAADRAGAGAFVWLSSIKVLGDVSADPLAPAAPYRPEGAYAASKVAAERALLDATLYHATLAIVRPPLVYGPEVRGNFRRLLRLASAPLPLPVARAVALRSLVSVDNLCDLLARLESGARGIFHVADDRDVSVRELLGEVRRQLGRRPSQIPVPPSWAWAAARCAGREGWYTRLFEPLRVDQSATRRELDWQPPWPWPQSLTDTVTWFRTSR